MRSTTSTRLLTLAALLAAPALLPACSANGGGTPSLPQVAGAGVGLAHVRGVDPTQAELGLWPREGRSKPACGRVPAGYARCLAWVRTDITAAPGIRRSMASVSGYAPSNLQAAYGLTSASAKNGAGVVVAIVDAFHDAAAASDLATYRKQFGLPACTTAGGCFTQVAYTSTANSGWAYEESLDIDMVSAICPNCKILLVEASSPTTAALVTAEKYATAHANYVSNSWGGAESAASSSDAAFSKVGGIITAATGDNGYNSPAGWPAILPTVVGVGGTSLTSISPRVESAWSGTGSGCSVVYAKPSFQTMNTGCSMRAQSDLSANADPNTGVAVYDSGAGGWTVLGGTSEATPIVASIFALGNTTTANSLSSIYANASKLFDVTGGSNGSCGAPLCQAGPGWDGPSGLGAPNGLYQGTTPTPTPAPTAKPTATPTAKPTATPTAKPTATPTAKPTPTPVPTPSQPPTPGPNVGLYVSIMLGNAVYKLNPNGSVSTVGSGYNEPMGLAVDPAGDVYVADAGNHAVKKVTPNGTITTIGSGFSSPSAVAIDSQGNVYVADAGSSSVKKIAPNGTMSTIGSGFVNPYGVAVDSLGNVYVGDTGNSAIKKVAANGTISVLGAGFNGPFGVAVDRSGNVYVADTYNSAVKMIAPNGTTSCVPASLTIANKCMGSGFDQPFGVVVDTAGNAYVADSFNYAVKMVQSGTISTLGVGFNLPAGIALDANLDPLARHGRHATYRTRR